MPSQQTVKTPQKLFVKPGEGRKVPLPIPGSNLRVPAEGMNVVKTIAVIRLLRVGDLIAVEAPAPAPAAAKQAAKEG